MLLLSRYIKRPNSNIIVTIFNFIVKYVRQTLRDHYLKCHIICEFCLNYYFYVGMS